MASGGMTMIHPQLQHDTYYLGRFPLSHLLLMNDAAYPWLILVPDRESITEVYQLCAEDQAQLGRESVLLAETLARGFQADKMNIAALGNVVPQLHLHHIVRYTYDPAWPAPVWGKHPAKPYDAAELQQQVDKLKALLGDEVQWSPVTLKS